MSMKYMVSPTESAGAGGLTVMIADAASTFTTTCVVRIIIISCWLVRNKPELDPFETDPLSVFDTVRWLFLMNITDSLINEGVHRSVKYSLQSSVSLSSQLIQAASLTSDYQAFSPHSATLPRTSRWFLRTMMLSFNDPSACQPVKSSENSFKIFSISHYRMTLDVSQYLYFLIENEGNE